MNTTIFTIESVHGVKQTFVLGPNAKPEDRSNSKEPSVEQVAGERETSNTSQSPR